LLTGPEEFIQIDTEGSFIDDNEVFSIPFILQLKKLQIKGITFGVRFRSKKIDTIKFDINKTEFNKLEIKKYLLLHFPLLL
jgi:hypothetical protein